MQQSIITPDEGLAAVRTRERLTLFVVFISIAGIVALGTIAIMIADAAERGDRVQLVFSSILPLFSTWVGVVLAYYYTRENFQAASHEVIRLSKSISSSDSPADLSLSPLMIPKSQITFAMQEQAATIRLLDILNQLQTKGLSKLPVLDHTGAVVAVYETEDILKYLYIEHKEFDEAQRQQLSLEQFIRNRISLRFTVIAFTKHVVDVQEQFNRIVGCEVVFVTATGQEHEPVLGMITSTDLAKKTPL